VDEIILGKIQNVGTIQSGRISSVGRITSGKIRSVGEMEFPAFVAPALPTPGDLGAAYWWRWWDGDSVTGLADGDSVVTSTGLVGGVDFVSASAGLRPTWGEAIMGGRDAVFFDGTEGIETAANLTLPTTFTAFVVGQIAGLATVTMIYEFTAAATSTSGWWLNPATNGDNVAYVKNVAGQSLYTQPPVFVSAITPQSIIHYCDGTHAGHKLRVAGSDLSMTGVGGFTGDPGSANIVDKMYVGRRSSGSPIWGWISEIAFFSGAPTLGLRDSLDAYVADNYDLGY
jgi:hypothetical protein